MPTYEYECARCGRTYEAFQSISEPPLTSCPRGHTAVRRLISGGAGLLFKGTGFYRTDYRSRAYRAAAKRESTSTSISAGGAETGAGPAPPADRKDG